MISTRMRRFTDEPMKSPRGQDADHQAAKHVQSGLRDGTVLEEPQRLVTKDRERGEAAAEASPQQQHHVRGQAEVLLSAQQQRPGHVDRESAPGKYAPDLSDQLRILLARQTGTPRGSNHRYLLSGILTCAVCGRGLYARPHRRGHRYTCVKEPGKEGCGTVSIAAARADDEVRDRILTALDRSAFMRALITTADGGSTADYTPGQLRAIDARRDELAATLTAADMSGRERLAGHAGRDVTAELLRSELARTKQAGALTQFANMHGTMRDRWDALSVARRRALIQSVAASVPVRPATRQGWDPDRIGEPLWRI